MSKHEEILAKSEDSGFVPLWKHLDDVSRIAIVVARNLGLDETIAYKGAVLHDIGKSSSIFQQTLKHGYRRSPTFIFRHEIASVFFISLLEDKEKDSVIDMIVAHHKSLYQDVRGLGFLDLDYNDDSFKIHSEKFYEWKNVALDILEEFGFKVHDISIEEAKQNYDYALSYCEEMRLNCSMWKGLLMAADHMASALNDDIGSAINKLYIKPDLSFYNRTSDLYPLSSIGIDDARKYTLVTAPTGAGKTDFLLRRCKGRVFYILPFQASINAMYDRIKSDLSETDSQIYLLHAASELKMEDGTLEERIMQRHIGASIKVLTPHQIASVVFGIKGFEAMADDLYGCDVILDEIHTYSDVIQAIVLKLIDVLKTLNCRIHIGTATMPTVLYNSILELLGGEDCVYQVKLSNDILATFNRHIIHKSESFEDCSKVIEDAVTNKRKILIVCNQVKRSQKIYESLKEQYSDTMIMLVHSRFKRERRQELETRLKNIYNETNEACIVVSTQVVEVSLDISFDVMVTECAPIDAMIQRFGRINRKRTLKTIGNYKPIYVIKPFEEEKDCLPYSVNVLQRSFEALPTDGLMKEIEVQDMLDKVYPEICFQNIDYSGVAFMDGQWIIKELCHRPKSALLETLDIDSAVCVIQNDSTKYREGEYTERTKIEIPVSFRSVGYAKLAQIDCGSRPFVIPDEAYSDELGLIMEKAKSQLYNLFL
ncbi:CRISPR-associated helicase/endonuclease Cas3 [Xylanibacter oryzae]|uniref:CRISPR-associated helicase/endonuclease Cas3 n=1 Tax=Xylanibacter oryzae TaxID=185293 RepID=UPI0004AE903F|nr:CRISPR-associated helicase/endonuclease Cas3 [Xylanibacter oryzae]